MKVTRPVPKRNTDFDSYTIHIEVETREEEAALAALSFLTLSIPKMVTSYWSAKYNINMTPLQYFLVAMQKSLRDTSLFPKKGD